jgi:hypothetical protein
MIDTTRSAAKTSSISTVKNDVVPVPNEWTSVGYGVD